MPSLHPMTAVYLDHNAAGMPRPQAVQAMARAMAHTGNPSSIHAPGKQARRMMEEARQQVAALVAVLPDQVVMTSGGTEANALALAQAAGGPVWVSAIEHLSILQNAPENARVLPVTSDGALDLEALRQALAEGERPALVSIMLANNETGVLQPVAQAVRMIRAASPATLVHTDAAQVAGRLPLSLPELDVDMATVSSSKLGGPMGAGALVIRRPDLLARPLWRGGGQENGWRAGTPNFAGIMGFGAAALAATRELALPEPPFAALAARRDAMESALAAATDGRIRFFGQGQARLPNTSCMAIPGLPSATQIMAFDMQGIAVSAGAACSSGKLAPSHVLRAMQVPEELATCALRVSMGVQTTDAELARFIHAACGMAQRERMASS